MQKIGITGDIGSGKTTVCRVFEHFGVPVYYSDAEAKKFYNQKEVKDKLYCLFGGEIFTEKYDIDKKKLAQTVFNNADLLQKLNRIIHPLVLTDFEQWSKNHEKHCYILFESAILYSCKLTHLFDKIIFVDAPANLIVERAMKRDKATSSEIKKRLTAQSSTEKPSITPDYIIYNNEKQLIIPQIMEIHRKLIVDLLIC